MKRYFARLVLVVFSCYTLLFGLASLRYQEKWERFQKKSEAVYTQIIEKNPSSAKVLLETDKNGAHSNRPAILNPRSVFCNFFCIRRTDAEMQNELVNAVVLFKDALSRVDLSLINFVGEGIDLYRADLRSANLSGADFSHAVLSEAILSRAILHNTQFIGTALNRADLSGAELQEARLSGADLREAHLRDADLTGANFRGARLGAADLRGANFFYADFVGADLECADLRRVSLSGADFREANFTKANLSGAVLSGARLNRADLNGADLDGADLRYADLSETIGMTEQQLARTISDGNTKWPKGFKGSVASQN